MLNVIGNNRVIATIHIGENTAADQGGIGGKAARVGERFGIGLGQRFGLRSRLSEGVGHGGREERESNKEFHSFGCSWSKLEAGGKLRWVSGPKHHLLYFTEDWASV